MRIAQVCVRFGAPGGAEAHVAAIAEGLARRGHEVEVFTSDLFTEVPWVRHGPFEAPPRGVAVRRFEMTPRTFPGKPIRMRGLAAALEGSGADVFHAHSHRYHHLRTTASVARGLRRPWCITPHYHPIEEGEPRWKHALARVADAVDARWVYAGASRIFTVTDLERRFIAHLAPPGRCVTIPNGIDLAAWRGADGAAFRDFRGSDRPYLLYAGRLASNKGLIDLIDAFAALADAHPDLDLVLAGKDWGEAAALEARARRWDLSRRVHLPGHLDPALHRSAVAGCAAFALPSEWEAFGIVLLEAMACGRPVVATAVGGVPEVVRDGREGLLVPHGDPASLAGALGAVLAEADLARGLGAAGRTRAEEYDWPRVVDRLEAELVAAVER